MGKFTIAVLGFFSGAALTAALSTMVFLHLFPAETEVWTTSSDLILDGNVRIPSGVELVHDAWMPEGFATLRLYVNVEGTALEKFERRTEQKRQLKIPYWVSE